MHPIVYDLSMLAALLLCGVGASVQWGWPVGLMVAGCQLAVTTFMSAALARR